MRKRGREGQRLREEWDRYAHMRLFSGQNDFRIPTSWYNESVRPGLLLVKVPCWLRTGVDLRTLMKVPEPSLPISYARLLNSNSMSPGPWVLRWN